MTSTPAQCRRVSPHRGDVEGIAHLLDPVLQGEGEGLLPGLSKHAALHLHPDGHPPGGAEMLGAGDGQRHREGLSRPAPGRGPELQAQPAGIPVEQNRQNGPRKQKYRQNGQSMPFSKEKQQQRQGCRCDAVPRQMLPGGHQRSAPVSGRTSARMPVRGSRALTPSTLAWGRSTRRWRTRRQRPPAHPPGRHSSARGGRRRPGPSSPARRCPGERCPVPPGGGSEWPRTDGWHRRAPGQLPGWRRGIPAPPECSPRR